MKLIIIFIIISVNTASQEPSDDTRICEHYCATGFLRDEYYEKVGYRSFFDYLRKDEHECVKTTDLGRDGIFSFIRNEPPVNIAGYIEDTDPEEVGLDCVKSDVNDSADVELKEDSCEGVVGYLQGVKPEGAGYEGAVDFLRGDKPEEVGYEGAVIYFRGLNQESGSISNVRQKYVENEDIYLETVNFHHCDESEDSVRNQCNVPDIEIDEAVVLEPNCEVYDNFEIKKVNPKQETQDVPKIPFIDFLDITTKSFDPEKEENIYFEDNQFECIKPDDVEEHVIKLPCHDETKSFNDEFEENYGFEIEIYPKTKTKEVIVDFPVDNIDDSYIHSECFKEQDPKHFTNDNDFKVIPKLLDLDARPEDYDPNCNYYPKSFEPKNVNIGYPIIDILTFNDLNNQYDTDNYDEFFQGDDPKAGAFTPIEHKIEDFEIEPVNFSKDSHKNFEPLSIYFRGNDFVWDLEKDKNFYLKGEGTLVKNFDNVYSDNHQSEILQKDDPGADLSIPSIELNLKTEDIKGLDKDDKKSSKQNIHNNKDLNMDILEEQQHNSLNGDRTIFSESIENIPEDKDFNLQGDDPDVLKSKENKTKSPEITQHDKYVIIVILFDYSKNDNLKASKQNVGDKDFFTNGGGPKYIDFNNFTQQDDDPKGVVPDDSNLDYFKDINNDRKTKKRIFLFFIISRSRQLIFR